ncbi:SPOR domain-containing protein [Vibrio methylphosphonaticus]|uniref:SPOR domain-containing protein n=1 Tax=Vibrio methylphosphonaticus TaxID=2946866 RepID=UPI00202A5B00|nr:SPOR domain-containing protein [Vibrio methylphosphonaticus]MCL9776923.1 SPOR domain-containing protein [Vibrio methylphosphonaticus]
MSSKGLILLLLLLVTKTVNAEVKDCYAVSDVAGSRQSATMVPTLDAECPIGDGFWGDVETSAKPQTYWIQCGFFRSSISVDEWQRLQQGLGVSVWVKPEKEGSRCLIGPYDSYAQAKVVKSSLQALPDYKDAFLRALPHGVSVKTIHSTKSALADKKSEASSTNAKWQVATPYMIAGEHARQDCLCFF